MPWRTSKACDDHMALVEPQWKIENRSRDLQQCTMNKSIVHTRQRKAMQL